MISNVADSAREATENGHSPNQIPTAELVTADRKRAFEERGKRLADQWKRNRDRDFDQCAVTRVRLG